MILTLLASGIFAVILTFAVLSLAAHPEAFFQSAVKRPVLFLFNILPVWVLTLLFISVFGICWPAFAFVSLPSIILALVNRFKVLIREEPFLPSDFILIREAMTFSDAAKGHIGAVLILIPACIAALIIGSVWLPARALSGLERMYIALASSILFLLLTVSIYASTRIFRHGSVSGSPYRPVDLCESRGFVYSFFHHASLAGVVKPEGYDKDRVPQILSGFGTTKDAVPGVNVVFVMGEAFTELSDESFFIFENDPLSPYKKLKNEGFAGKLIVPNYGGGTANTEFDVLTGLYSMFINPSPSSFSYVRRSFPSIVSAFREHGYSTIAVHPGFDWFYNRREVYPRLGFEQFLTAKDFSDAEYKGGLVSDRSAFQKLRNVITQSPSPQFSYMVTIQTHTPFENKFEKNSHIFNQARDILSPAEVDILSNYFIGVTDAARELSDFTDFLNSRPEPTLLVFYGDHLPSLGSAMGIYNELGFDKGLRKYETPYLIWQNDASKPIFSLEKSLDIAGLRRGDSLGAHYMGALILELLGLDGGNPFYQYVNALRRKHPALTAYAPPDDIRTVADYQAVQYLRLTQ